jgi:repressor LexA
MAAAAACGSAMLTARQSQILSFIQKFSAKHGYAPSLEEIGRAMKLSSLATVHKHVTNLESKGVIDRKHGMARQMSVTSCCPLCGKS